MRSCSQRPFFWTIKITTFSMTLGCQITLPSFGHQNTRVTTSFANPVLVGGQYLTFSDANDQASWDQARRKCESKNTKLVSIKDPIAFKSYAQRHYGNQDLFWLGGHDKNQEGRWEWINGMPFQNDKIKNSNFNNLHNNEDCLLWWGGNYNDLDCKEAHHRYVCEHDIPVCEFDPGWGKEYLKEGDVRTKDCTRYRCSNGYMHNSDKAPECCDHGGELLKDGTSWTEDCTEHKCSRGRIESTPSPGCGTSYESD